MKTVPTRMDTMLNNLDNFGGLIQCMAKTEMNILQINILLH